MTKKLRKKPNILLTSDRPHSVYGDPESRRCTAVKFRTVSKWRRRFLRHGIAGLEDAPRSGKPARYDQVTARRSMSSLKTIIVTPHPSNGLNRRSIKSESLTVSLPKKKLDK
jgi:hypothetical protein